MIIEKSFPGGNILVDRMSRDEAWIRPDLHGIEGEWFYWCFQASGAPAGQVRFHFNQENVFGSLGPACSEDGGATWRWLGAESINGNSFEYRFAQAGSPVIFSVGVPYTARDWDRFLHSGIQRSEPGILCYTVKGRPVEYLRFGCLTSEPGHRILLTCRHHACEAMASFVIEGLVRHAAIEHPRRFANVEFLVVPFMDKDGVEDGDQGKNRRPRDHNRDYDGVSLHRETAALREWIPAWSQGKLSVAFDFHCPWLKGGINDTIYLVGSDSSDIAGKQEKFLNILRSAQSESRGLSAAGMLPFGVDWNVEESFSAGMTAARWFGGLPGMTLSSTWEIPYALASGMEVNPDSARGFGADLGRALADYLGDLEIGAPRPLLPRGR